MVAMGGDAGSKEDTIRAIEAAAAAFKMWQPFAHMCTGLPHLNRDFASSA